MEKLKCSLHGSQCKLSTWADMVYIGGILLLKIAAKCVKPHRFSEYSCKRDLAESPVMKLHDTWPTWSHNVAKGKKNTVQ